jgi:hypothetical protein
MGRNEDGDMSKGHDGLLFRILFWPMNSMNDTIEQIHAGMDEKAPDEPFLEEDKRAIGVGGALGGCIMTLLWLLFLLVLFIVSLVLIINYLVGE